MRKISKYQMKIVHWHLLQATSLRKPRIRLSLHALIAFKIFSPQEVNIFYTSNSKRTITYRTIWCDEWWRKVTHIIHQKKRGGSIFIHIFLFFECNVMKNNWRKDKQRSFNRLFVEVFYDLSERFSAYQRVSTRYYFISSTSFLRQLTCF